MYAWLDHEEFATRLTVRLAAEAYEECGLWTSPTSSDDVETLSEFLDGTDAEVSDEAREAMWRDVYDFLCGVWDAGLDLGELCPEQIGHDFWLTRNRHGAGFWDRGLGDLGDTLTDMAHPYGEAYLYLGDDGMIHYGE